MRRRTESKPLGGPGEPPEVHTVSALRCLAAATGRRRRRSNVRQGSLGRTFERRLCCCILVDECKVWGETDAEEN
jgi:hypothetical protein